MAELQTPKSEELDYREVQEVWYSLTTDLPVAVREKWWKIVSGKYMEPERHYHTLQLLRRLLRLHNAYRNKLRSPKAVALALIFQNIVYDPRAGDNDERSAQKFQEFAQEVGYGSGSTFRDEVISLIRLTATHCTTEHLSRDAFGCEDRHYFLDMGMALLGGTREEYEADALRIRREYGFLPENVYKELRTKILRSFLEIPNIYATPDFRHHFEEQARRNILNEVSRLSGGGDSTDV